MKTYEVHVDDNGSREWTYNDELHREDGPAVEHADGSREWWLNGELHREDGPAIEWVDDHRAWYMNGKLHREDGPAVEQHTNGYRAWWLNGKKMTEEEHRAAAQPAKEMTRDDILEAIGSIRNLTGELISIHRMCNYLEANVDDIVESFDKGETDE